MLASDEMPLALKIADQILDRPNGDPDRDVAVLARVFLRTISAILNQTESDEAVRARELWLVNVAKAVEASGVKGLTP